MKNEKAFVPIGNFRWIKPSAHVPEKSLITVYKKLRLNDVLMWKDSYVRVDYMIENHPLDLWNMIYNRSNGQKAISLESRALKSLKSEVMKLKPEWIEEVNRKRQRIRTQRNKIN